jgi:cell division protein ZapA
MGQVSVTLNGRTYRLNCGDGEEPHLLDVVAHVRRHVDRLTREHGQIGDERLLLMTSILITDELYELRKAVEQDVIALNESDLAPRLPAPPSQAPRQPVPERSVAPASVTPRLQPVLVTPAQHVNVLLQPAPEHNEGSEPAKDTPVLVVPAPTAQPKPAASPQVGRGLDLLDATALMKGLEKKATRV